MNIQYVICTNSTIIRPYIPGEGRGARGVEEVSGDYQEIRVLCYINCGFDSLVMRANSRGSEGGGGILTYMLLIVLKTIVL